MKLKDLRNIHTSEISLLSGGAVETEKWQFRSEKAKKD